MSWLYVPGTAGSASGSSSLNLDSAQSATWRGKPSLPRSWSARWKRGGWIRLLSGLTCDPSTLDHGVAVWTSFLRGSRASPSLKPASASLRETPVTSGPTSPASSPKQLPLWFSSRTSPFEPSSNPSETFEQWASASRRQSDALRKTWALRTAATAGSPLLPTPSATSYGSTNNGCPKDGRKQYATKGTPSLETMARHNLWPTPIVGDSRAAGCSSCVPRSLVTYPAVRPKSPVTPKAFRDPGVCADVEPHVSRAPGASLASYPTPGAPLGSRARRVAARAVSLRAGRAERAVAESLSSGMHGAWL